MFRKTPVVCSCHFNDSGTFPIPYLEKRKLQQIRDDSEPQEKRFKVEPEISAENEFIQHGSNELDNETYEVEQCGSGYNSESNALSMLFDSDAMNSIDSTYWDEEFLSNAELNEDTENVAIQANVISIDQVSHVSHEIIHDNTEVLES